MAKRPKSFDLTKGLLLGIAVGATPVLGTVAGAQNAAGPTTVTVSAAEYEAYNRAITNLDAASANTFLGRYPSSPLARSLLTRLAPGTLRQIDRSVVGRLDRATVSQLPQSVRLGLGAAAAPAAGTTVTDGYSG